MRGARAALGILFLSACRHAAPPRLVDAVPGGVTAIARVDLSALRRSAFAPKLPAILPDSPEVLVVWNGSELLQLARATPSGFAPIGEGIAASGPAAQIRAARAQLSKGRPDLEVGASAIWAAVYGDGRLPLTGNLANANLLLRLAQRTEIAVSIEATVDVTVTAYCRTDEQAQRFAEQLRAAITMSELGFRKQPEVAAMLKSARVTKEKSLVRAQMSSSAETLLRLL